MKQTQWVIAALTLAGMVFIVTFAMNYLGEGRRVTPTAARRQPQRDVGFFWQSSPINGLGVNEFEANRPGYQDFWFRNDQAEAVKVGLFRKGCKCTGVDLFTLPDTGLRPLILDAVALWGTARSNPLLPLSLQSLAAPELQKGAEGPHELLFLSQAATVPAGAVGWVRLRWKGDRGGRQTLNADLWMNDVGSGKTTLETHVRIDEPLRYQATLAMGTLRDEALAGTGVTQDVICWSSTRPSLRLEAKAAQVRGNSSADPFGVGDPIPMTPAEIRELEMNNQKAPDTAGPVLCAYRIPVTLRAVALDGKTPFDLGPFHRGVILSSPDAPGEPRQVAVTGRIRGAIEIGNDESGEINFGAFPQSKGKRATINLQSDVPDLTLTFDRDRTLKFLSATLSKPDKVDERRQTWTLRAEVKPGEASGVFPRREDPLYEDSAIYLKAVAPGLPPRSVRIAVQGMATVR